MISQVVKQKIQNLSVHDLLEQSRQFNVPLTKAQATEIVSFLKSSNLNPLDEKDRMKALKKLAQITDPKTAQKVNKIFQEMIKENGLSHWF
ncbi:MULTISPECIES: DUF2624 domain-containing protein [Pontibacillus]|uniref:DUF2624 domain-containing protein n=1 Tax=Pontibacillus chungwhensis TaxID=265426 RepID=A0ABY8V394_9BACI|nr:MULTISPECIES: DUF2624 domain-containing protein [Pontibacillus]MCD5323595.1 DUF2624 domain-containing protein [Pontibacillus sp. HN14]WIG00220.1 DUF2624 domain-containing protein [Pontibacillus chungwhensis]